MAAAQWRKLRIWSLEKATVDAASREYKPAIACGSATHTQAFFTQQEMRYDRQFHRGLKCFHEDRAARLRSKKSLGTHQ